MWRTDLLEKIGCWERLKVGGEGDVRGWDGWMVSLTWWTWVWVSSGSWWWTESPSLLQSMGCKELDTTEWLNWLTDWPLLTSPSLMKERHSAPSGYKNHLWIVSFRPKNILKYNKASSHLFSYSFPKNWGKLEMKTSVFLQGKGHQNNELKMYTSPKKMYTLFTSQGCGEDQFSKYVWKVLECGNKPKKIICVIHCDHIDKIWQEFVC